MLSAVKSYTLESENDWSSFLSQIGLTLTHPLLINIVSSLKSAGVKGCIFEDAYLDRDFSASYSRFYSTLFKPYQKYCKRLHFFGENLKDLNELVDANAISKAVECKQSTYFGFVTIRPLSHAPVSIAVLCKDKLRCEIECDVGVYSTFDIHVMGATLRVKGMPLTQQDTRIGACAQAAMWMAGRHFHNKHRAPWFSVPEITDRALKPTDSVISKSLPAGSDYLLPDNMVRALSAMQRHPIVYAVSPDGAGGSTWGGFDVTATISRYVDSGIPVILVMDKPTESLGHAVVAVGTKRKKIDITALSVKSTQANFLSHFLVNDDQRGSYLPLAVGTDDFNENEYPFNIEEHLKLIFVPLPDKVFITGEIAERLALDKLSSSANHLHAFAQRTLEPAKAKLFNPHPEFIDAAKRLQVISRTYLTYGWRYKSRALRNNLSAKLKSSLITRQFPKYVWVTEFSLPSEATSHDPCNRIVRAHVVTDATGSQMWESAQLLDMPGLLITWTFDPNTPADQPSIDMSLFEEDFEYFPKIRGIDDYVACEVR